MDGNKRTGISAAGLFLRMNGYRLNPANTVEVAQSRYTIKEIADWLQEH